MMARDVGHSKKAAPLIHPITPLPQVVGVWGGDNLAQAMNGVQMMLQRDTASISALRVLQLFLQRIGAGQMVRLGILSGTTATPGAVLPPILAASAACLLKLATATFSVL
jgi:hypothetical protein